MKISAFISSLLASLLLVVSVADAKSVQAKKKAEPRYNAPKLGTSFRFTGSSLYGKYQAPLGSTATAENDKYLEDLLGARKNFADRIANDVERN